MQYKTIIGLEVHIEPNTKTKMFCRCSQDHFGKQPNTNTCPICLGLPGALPIANKEAVYKTIKLGLALGSTINKISRFDRKHYFYPDLPKSFQTSQKDNPFCIGGSLLGKELDHIHLEEDAGKLVHDVVDGEKVSLIDFNRSGCALIELVTKPVFHSVDEVISFLKELQLVTKYLNVGSADMEKGTMRLEANISLAPIINNQSLIIKLPDYKVELKNINSFRFLEKALTAEIERQTKALNNNEKLIQETRGYDEAKKTTFSQREKADSHDYKYFPEADLAPVQITNTQISIIKQEIPELPQEKRERFEKEYQISKEYIEILVQDITRANYYEKACKLNNNYKTIANLIVNKKMDETYPEPAGLIKMLVEMENKSFESAEKTELVTREVLKENPEIIKKYQNGQTQVIGFLIGQVQKKLSGKGDIKVITDLLLKQINF
jgi:aspartyl-tRNA(Asn)/glutamyl-tRNA(Gln) amidotransferase subunit B